jgi:hypothetical protein
VLTEGDDQQDPIADSARAILDGHIVLNRRLAEAGHYPAIDIEQSISRAMHSITSHEHQTKARQLKQLFSRFERSRDLISVGAYAAGTIRCSTRPSSCTNASSIPAATDHRTGDHGRELGPTYLSIRLIDASPPPII